MTYQANPLTCTADRPRPATGWLARLGRLAIAAHREAFVSHHELDRRLLADINAPQIPPTQEELRDAYRRWFGGDVMRHL